MSYFKQGSFGKKGNFELVTPVTHGEGLEHNWRDNDSTTLTWGDPTCFGRGFVDGVTMIQGNYGSPGNLEVVAVEGNRFWAYARLNQPPFTWFGPTLSGEGVRGIPSMIQSNNGDRGNFELVVPHQDGGLTHWWRNNDDGNLPWIGPLRFGDGRMYEGAAVIQSNYGRLNAGHLEVVAVTGNALVHYWRDDAPPWNWHGPYHIGFGVSGGPSLIQSSHGNRGDFQVIVPSDGGGLLHFFRQNDDSAFPWRGPFGFGDQRRYRSASVIQSNFGDALEVIALDMDGHTAFYFRNEQAPFAWNGPFPVGTERSWNMSECNYNWPVKFYQMGTHVLVKIQLVGVGNVTAAQLAQRQPVWRNAIIAKWSDRFKCLAPNGESAPITFDVQWVASNAHQVVNVSPSGVATNMRSWNIIDSGDAISHEFGHMLGLPDEYTSSLCPGRSPVNTANIMDDNTNVVTRHLNQIAGFHCGHRPAPRFNLSYTIDMVRDMNLFERQPESDKKKFKSTLREFFEGSEQVSHFQLQLSVSGGAQRYQSEIRVDSDGIAVVRIGDSVRRGTVPREVLAAAVRQVVESGLIEWSAEQQEIVPDTLVVALVIEVGDVRKMIYAPLPPQTEIDPQQDLFALIDRLPETFRSVGMELTRVRSHLTQAE
jgi:hypothetical protein